MLWCLGASTMNIEELMIVTEWVTNGTLRNLLENNSIDLTWPMQMSLASQIAKGLEFIHSMHLIHCDIKSYNIMLGDNLVVKIIGKESKHTNTHKHRLWQFQNCRKLVRRLWCSWNGTMNSL